MPSVPFKILLFLSSYFPLFAILTLLSFSKNRTAAYIFAAIGLISWIAMELYLWYVRNRINPESIRISSCKRCDSEILSYIVTYLIPFMVDFSKPPIELAALGIFFVMIGFLYVNSNMIHINPMLSFRGFHLFEITLSDGSVHSLLSKNKVRSNTDVKVVIIGEEVYIERKQP